MFIEFHDDDFDNVPFGTLCARVEVDYPYQAEEWVRMEFEENPEVMRAVVHEAGRVLAVWKRTKTGLVYAGVDPAWPGTWELPFLRPEATGIEVLKELPGEPLETEQGPAESAKAWAASVLGKGKASCAVILDGNDVVVAWERIGEAVILVARRPH